MLTFKVWFYLNDPLIILNNNQRTCFLDATKDIDPKDKKQFLKLIPMCEKSRIDAVESSLLNLNK